jgi:hypothetical protein
MPRSMSRLRVLAQAGTTAISGGACLALLAFRLVDHSGGSHAQRSTYP